MERNIFLSKLIFTFFYFQKNPRQVTLGSRNIRLFDEISGCNIVSSGMDVLRFCVQDGRVIYAEREGTYSRL